MPQADSAIVNLWVLCNEVRAPFLKQNVRELLSVKHKDTRLVFQMQIPLSDANEIPEMKLSIFAQYLFTTDFENQNHLLSIKGDCKMPFLQDVI